ncbi:nicotinate-nucleotide adenylyltransferase [Marinilabiliaceae bacterium JC017]|nr:nicotinate-nucleotide adenylyltransferase [Marinilabiliaceae bacterium JC017]
MNSNKHIGLFFGSFNPIHLGHYILANYMVEFEKLDEVWFVVSPQNPFKESNGLANEQHRLAMTNIACEGFPNLKVCDIEFSLSKPSYTINTLEALEKEFPSHQFHLIMGADNLENIDRWKEASTIINQYPILVYRRMGYSNDLPTSSANITISKAPIVELSSTQIREWIKSGLHVKGFIPPGVFEYIRDNQLYQ